MSETAQTDPKPADDAAVHDAHLAQLYSMSRTAGLTDTGYVAVNPLSIASLLLSIAGLLLWAALEFAFLGLMLALPLVGVVAGVIAIRKINDSNGTQTGKKLAWAGVILGVLCVAGSTALEIKARAEEATEARAVAQTIRVLGDALKAGDYDKAYDQFDPEWRKVWSRDELKSFWEGIQANPRVGRLVTFEWNGIPPRDSGAGGGSPIVVTQAIGKFHGTQEDRFTLQLRRSDDRWLIVDMPNVMPFERAAPKKK